MFLGLSVSPIQPAHRAMPKQRSVVAFGDSLTAGAGASSPDHSYPALAASLFDPPRIILNCGMGGQTSTQIAARQGGKPLLLAVQGPESKNLFPRSRDWMASFDAGVIDGLAHELLASGIDDAGLP
ncbi:SGNH/GDSL hydrolase family protein [Rhizobium sp. YTU87027]|uniref:SGNH/GDSL hydrolase family protein n=1 Tax=Rhizobium sp. YTU87027 TaxID=3417741 RepID=UPI003D69BBA2